MSLDIWRLTKKTVKCSEVLSHVRVGYPMSGWVTLMKVWGGTSPLLEITTARSITTNSLQGLSSVARL